ncbi:cytochrome c biogenesis protein CcmG/thiol:disulfide interchange protein DsbE [Pararhizobium capsulatum DSM 1112]|uniref:Cytochrome c biogenesis protein CcmG/thiol:disulfide interchange protein DsbE n=1 Tax=Pararhizobium capsulatum DSM 1112 TaxID=1121113 RepID=A0ABU0BMB8_9HYPH|nr:DsbE family thiol:disulfide interchange protein [Pararhizobium capsulatum]MDQ0318037.1 cytochrome c biogenesis protein CcmG/thiol:disulfide interchange protein DsbE [Pararhizobium capsulatum DSM 1112]
MTDETRTTNSEVAERPSKARYVLALLPLAIFGALAAVFWSQLDSGRDISEIPSALIGTKAPSLDMPPLEGANLSGAPMPALTDAAIKGKLTLVNIWASWCIPCREENPIILDLAKDPRLQVVGINYKDKTGNALSFLGELGNPFSAIGVDPRGKAAIDWGVYGIPESYLVGADGTILYKRVGPFDDRSLKEGLFPAIEAALAGKS